MTCPKYLASVVLDTAWKSFYFQHLLFYPFFFWCIREILKLKQQHYTLYYITPRLSFIIPQVIAPKTPVSAFHPLIPASCYKIIK